MALLPLHSTLNNIRRRIQETLSVPFSPAQGALPTESTPVGNADETDDVQADGGVRPSLRYFRALSESTRLPAELVSQILDFAEVWSTVEMCSYTGPLLRIQSGSITVTETSAIVLTQTGRSSLRRIVFRFSSKDQGWSSNNRTDHGTYRHSYTWLEAVIRSSPSTPRQATSGYRSYELQRNRHAGKQYENYKIALDREHDIFGHLEPDCVIGLQACAHFPGWTNYISSGCIEFQFADTFEESPPTYSRPRNVSADCIEVDHLLDPLMAQTVDDAST